jgi:hypothetical protein
MTAYAYDAAGWFTGEVPDDTPNSTPVAPPLLNIDDTPDLPRARWFRSAWYVLAYPGPTPLPLAVAKKAKRSSINDEAFFRVRARLGDIFGSPDGLNLVRVLWLSIAPAARQPTADMQWLIALALAVQAALGEVDAAATIAEVEAVAVAWPA